MAGRLSTLRRALWLVGLALFVALPTEALACPNCAMRPDNPSRSLLIIVMILLPWSVVTATWFFIKRQMRDEPGVGSSDDHLPG